MQIICTTWNRRSFVLVSSSKERRTAATTPRIRSHKEQLHIHEASRIIIQLHLSEDYSVVFFVHTYIYTDIYTCTDIQRKPLVKVAIFVILMISRYIDVNSFIRNTKVNDGVSVLSGMQRIYFLREGESRRSFHFCSFRKEWERFGFQLLLCSDCRARSSRQHTTCFLECTYTPQERVKKGVPRTQKCTQTRVSRVSSNTSICSKPR